ncbi:MAG: biopolymer transporter ExbD [Bacteroidota bacterium]|nr:biopolymer transporter ExbD [Bacteroidota bacterium]MDE2833141.1 biopolymer transporter ExbD [Bacteroidota bacterium]MDE2956372.1 biopolymer transporter ExbD [Bacteroidota bacterium]
MGVLAKRKKRDGAEIPTSSMADIAFLLLIFFLVTTTIDVDTGIGMTLPPKLDENVEPPPVRERNILKILINEQGQVLLEDLPSSVAQIRGEVLTHVRNMGRDLRYSESPDKAVVSIKTDRQTPYNMYIQTLDEVWMAYFEIWDNEARSLGFLNYQEYRSSLDDPKANEIREQWPAQVSLAEPDPGA